MTAPENYDVIIVGGSYAGLSAAMTLGRSRRNVLVIDSGLPCNRQTPHSHNFLTLDGESPQAIAEKAKAQVLRYPSVKFHEGLAVSGKMRSPGFEITTQSGKIFGAKKLIFATGIKDIMPDIKGFEECWGISVIHCPYCHGYEFRDQKTGILTNLEKALHLTPLIHNLTKDLTLFVPGEGGITDDQLVTLTKRNIKIVDKPIVEIAHENGHIKAAVFRDDTSIELDALYAPVPFIQHSALPVDLGCELTEQGYIQVDEFQETTVEGIYACGDNTSPMRSVATAVAKGNFAGAMINMELANADFWPSTNVESE